MPLKEKHSAIFRHSIALLVDPATALRGLSVAKYCCQCGGSLVSVAVTGPHQCRQSFDSQIGCDSVSSDKALLVRARIKSVDVDLCSRVAIASERALRTSA